MAAVPKHLSNLAIQNTTGEFSASLKVYTYYSENSTYVDNLYTTIVEFVSANFNRIKMDLTTLALGVSYVIEVDVNFGEGKVYMYQVFDDNCTITDIGTTAYSVS